MNTFVVGDKVKVVSDVGDGDDRGNGMWIGLHGVVTHIYEGAKYRYQLDDMRAGPFATEELETVEVH